MAEKTYMMQMGMGVDLHGQDPTKAASRAVHNAIMNNCLCGISDVLGDKGAEDKMHVHVLITCPRPNEVNKEQVLKELPFGVKTIEVKEGGMAAPHVFSARFGDKSPETIVCNAAVTVSYNHR
ncbi:MAG: Lin0512 family protein [Candidatus Abyssubacteria bacterium]